MSEQEDTQAEVNSPAEETKEDLGSDQPVEDDAASSEPHPNSPSEGTGTDPAPAE